MRHHLYRSLQYEKNSNFDFKNFCQIWPKTEASRQTIKYADTSAYICLMISRFKLKLRLGFINYLWNSNIHIQAHQLHINKINIHDLWAQPQHLAWTPPQGSLLPSWWLGPRCLHPHRQWRHQLRLQMPGSALTRQLHEVWAACS